MPTTEPNIIPAIGLIRQSKGKDSTLSPDTQRGGIMVYADHKGFLIKAEHWVEEIDVPGDAFRPGLEKAIGLIEAGEAKALITWKVDRLGREPVGIYTARDRVEKAGGSLHFADEGIDLESEAGDMLLGVFAGMAKGARRRIGSNWKYATKAANEAGVHQGRVIGYVRPEVAKGAKALPLEIDPAAAPILRQVFTMRAANASWSSICDYLNGSGLKPLRADSWSINSVCGLIHNRAYLGEAKQGELVNRNAHPAMVSLSLWTAANAVRGSSHAKTNDYILSGLCRCQGCRYRLRGQSAGRPGYGPSYRCRKRHGAGICESTASIDCAAVEAYVVAEVFKRHDVLIESASKSLDIEALNGAVTHAETELRAFRDAVPATDEFFAEGYRNRSAKVTQARQDRDNALTVLAPEGVPMLSRLSEQWDGLSIADKRAALKGLIAYVVVRTDEDGSQAQVVWRGEEVGLGPVPKTGAGQKSAVNVVAGILPFPWLTDDAMSTVGLTLVT